MYNEKYVPYFQREQRGKTNNNLLGKLVLYAGLVGLGAVVGRELFKKSISLIRSSNLRVLYNLYQHTVHGLSSATNYLKTD
jgi:hypothetical protein